METCYLNNNGGGGKGGPSVVENLILLSLLRIGKCIESIQFIACPNNAELNDKIKEKKKHKQLGTYYWTLECIIRQSLVFGPTLVGRAAPLKACSLERVGASSVL